jgi:hypothetical protein
MRRPLPDLGRWLLRSGVRRLTAGRDECAVCRRSPLVGERVGVYADGHVVCALCAKHQRREPDRIELVRHSELGHAVKPAVRIAA